MYSANSVSVFPPTVGIFLGPLMIIAASLIVAKRRGAHAALERFYERHFATFYKRVREENENYRFFLFDMPWVMLLACGGLLFASAIAHLA